MITISIPCFLSLFDQVFYAMRKVKLLFPRKLFDLIFTSHSRFLCLMRLSIEKRDRSARSGVFAGRAAVVGSQALFQIIGPAGVQRIIGTAENVGVIHSSLSPR